MKKLLLSLAFVSAFCFAKAQGPYPSSNINLIGFINPETVAGTDAIKYSGCWGYNQTSKNKEYAVVGSSTGTYFIDITAPATPTVCDYVKGKQPSPCIWREVNIYQNFAYVVSDDPSPNSFQIIDMQYLPDSVHVVYDGSLTYFERAHQVYVDGNKLYISGIRFSGSGSANMRVYSLATPSAPVLLRTLSQDYPSITYVHDMHVRNDTVFASCGNQGLQVYKFTSSNTFSALGSLTGYTDAGYNHSSSLTKDGKTLVFCDEVPTGLRIKCADVTNLTNITISSLFRPNTNSQFVGHNPYVIGNKYAFISCYEDGLNLYDISSPATPTLVGYFDTYPQGGANFSNNYGTSSYNGNWGAFPYFKSGLILACDMQNGVFILGATAFAPAANFNSAVNICSGVATTFTDVSTNSPTSFSWNMPGASPSTSGLQNPSITYSLGGVYSVTLIAANASGTNSIVKSITVTATPTVNITGTSSVCVGNSATLTASGASTYTWNPGALTGTNVVVSPTTNITYTLIGITSGCSNIKTKTITVNALPLVTASNSVSACNGNVGCLISLGALTYTWVGPCGFTSTQQAPCFPFSQACVCAYSVTGTDINGCSKTATVCINVIANPTVTAFTSNTLICVGQTATLTSGGATTYSWSTSGSGSVIAVSPTVSTNYTVTGTNSSGCVNSTSITQSVSTCANINELIESSLINVFPNPASTILNVSIQDNGSEFYKIEIRNIQGQIVLSETELENKTNQQISKKLNISNLASGIYMVIVSGGESKMYKKVVINR